MAADQGVTVAAPNSLTVGRRAALAFLLVPPLAWLVVAYLGSLAVLLVSAFWTTDSFTGAVVHTFTGDNWLDLRRHEDRLRADLALKIHEVMEMRDSRV